MHSKHVNPVAWQWFHLNQWHVTNDEDRARDLAWDGVKVEPLYAAPQLPQPAVPECYQRLLKHAYGMTMGHDWNKGTMAGHHREKLCKAVEECRAAMLQGAEPVQATTLRDGWVAVPVEPTAEMVKKMRYHCGGYDKNIKDGYKAMLAAAPQQEVK